MLLDLEKFVPGSARKTTVPYRGKIYEKAMS